MLISVTAPKKGMGQTQCAINIAATATRKIKGKVLLGDINKYSKDIEYYFSDSHGIKGLDDIISLVNTGLLSKDNFISSVKSINSQLDIMISNECFELQEENVNKITDVANSMYELMIFDTIAGTNKVSKIFFEISDVVVVIINQYKNVIDMILKSNIYKEYKHKLVFIVNKNQSGLNLKIADIKNELWRCDIKSEVFPVNYDVGMINECNDHSVLNYVLNDSSKGKETLSQISIITDYLFKTYGKNIQVKDSITKQGFLSLGRFKK